MFYNPVQEFNRDISILCIREYESVIREEAGKKNKQAPGLTICEALAATGLRSVRYMKEISNIKKIVSNDLDPYATTLMQINFDHNNCDSGVYEIHTKDAIDLMNLKKMNKEFFNVVDLDPYGTAVPFLDSAIQSMGKDGLLCVTFTDMAVLCARKPEVCFYKYGGTPLGKSHCHELALRMVLRMIS